jgi:DNA repair protein RadC
VFINTFIHTTNERLTALSLEVITERTLRFWVSQGIVSKPERVGRHNMWLGNHVDQVINERNRQWEASKMIAKDKAIKASASASFAVLPITEIAGDGDGVEYIIPHVEFRIVHETKSTFGAVRGPEGVVKLIRELTDGLTDERFYAVSLDNRNNVLAVHLCSIGDHSSTLVHPRSVFRTAVYSSAIAIVCAHNHPSGDATPSAEDIAVTRRLYEAGKVLGIPVLDHVVIGGNTHSSMRQLGYL